MTNSPFTITVNSFEALVDLEMALDGYIDDLSTYRYRNEREQETLDNLYNLREQVVSQRKPITKQRKLMRLLQEELRVR